ncbi:MAG: hypothetical protein ACXVP0_10000 [Bacteroidia bacterium]
MFKKLITCLCIMGVSVVFAQKPKPKKETATAPVAGTEVAPARVDSFMGFALLDGMTPYEALEYQLPHETEEDPVTHKKTFFKDRKKRNDSIRVAFRNAWRKKTMSFYVRTVRPKKAGEHMQLCINIVTKDTNLTYCVPDSACKDPELAKVMYQKQVGDTVYVLVLVDAFAKSGGACNGQHETKIVYARWHPKENKAIWRAKKIASCATTITNMSKTPVNEWDGKSMLEISYNKGSAFTDLFFDPDHPEKGIQNTKGGASKD